MLSKFKLSSQTTVYESFSINIVLINGNSPKKYKICQFKLVSKKCKNIQIKSQNNIKYYYFLSTKCKIKISFFLDSLTSSVTSTSITGPSTIFFWKIVRRLINLDGWATSMNKKNIHLSPWDKTNNLHKKYRLRYFENLINLNQIEALI